jgi:hypothetical protein
MKVVYVYIRPFHALEMELDERVFFSWQRKRAIPSVLLFYCPEKIDADDADGADDADDDWSSSASSHRFSMGDIVVTKLSKDGHALPFTEKDFYESIISPELRRINWFPQK